jgi:hypothetical protein
MFGDKYPTRKFDDWSKNNRFSMLHKFNVIGVSNLLKLRFSLCKKIEVRNAISDGSGDFVICEI